MDRMDHTKIDTSTSASPSLEHCLLPHTHLSLGRHAVGIVLDAPPAGPNGSAIQVNINTDAHIIINDIQGRVVDADGGVGVEDRTVSMELNNDFAIGLLQGSRGDQKHYATRTGNEYDKDGGEEERQWNGPGCHT